MRKLSKAAIALGTSAALITSAGVAYAYWTTTGNGSDSSTGASSNGSVVFHSTFDAATVAPGSASVTVTYSATNAGASDLAISNPVAVVTSNKGSACTGYLHLSAQPTQGQTVVAAGGASSALGSAQLTMDNSADNQDGCKGQSITVAINA